MKPYAYFLARLFGDGHPGAFPFRLSVETTNRCNLACPLCPRETSGRGYGHMTFDLFASIARQAAGREIVFYPQGFGEPFLHPRFREMLELANEAGVLCTDVITNATLLDEKNCRALVESQTRVVTVSVDGADKASFERARAGASYEEVVDNVLRLLRVRDEAKSELPHVVLSAVSTPDVEPSIAAFRAFWEPRLRATDDVFVCTPVTWAGAQPAPDRRPATPDELRERKPCRMLKTTLQVYYDGRTTPCCYDHACALEVGDASRSTIEEIWNGEPLRRLRDLHENGRSGEIPLCRDCPDHLP